MIRRIYSNFKKYKFKSQTFFTFFKYFLILLALFSIILSAVGIYMMSESQDNLQIENKNRVQRIEDMTNVIFKQTNRIASSLCIDNNVGTYVHGKANFINEKIEKGLIEKLVYYKNIANFIDSIYIYAPKTQRICTTNMLFYGTEQFGEFYDYDFLYWLEKNMKENTMTIPRKINGTYPRVISFIRAIPEGGYVIINIGYEKFIDNLEMVFDSKTEIYILDNTNRIVFPENIAEDDIDNIKIVLGEENGKYLNKSSKQMYSTIRIENYMQQFVVKCDMSDLLNARKNIILIVLFAWLIFVILSIFTAALLSISSLKIVIKLQDVLQQKNVNLHNMSDSEEKFVIVEILKLMDENRLFRKKLEDTLCHFNKMQLMSLQKQINPHFLNNMLSMICYRIQNDDNDETAINMIVMLTRIINYGFNNDAVIVPLSQEIDFMKTYITILKEGYRDFEFITDIDESLLNHKVLRLSIQPFVENAFYHGIRRKKSDGRITLSAKKEGQKVVITVEDNGIGMSLDKIREINELIKNGSNSKHIGIYNAYQRLKVVYFDECSLTYESDGVSGTKMTLVTPILIDNNFENFL